MVLYKRSGRLCIRISTLYNLNKEIWIQQRWEAPSVRAVALRKQL